MTPELTALTLAALLQLIQYAIYAIPANLQVGTKYALSPRDDPKQVTGFAGRAQRALNNHFEGLILFTIAVTATTLADAQSQLTAICAWAYLAARVAYVPAYLFGWVPWRSLFFQIGWVATATMLIATLLSQPALSSG